MENINFILCILYLILGILNMFGIMIIDDISVFGMTVGTLFLCLAPLFNKKNIRVIYYILAAGFVVGFHYINGASRLIDGVDNNTWLLLSLSVTFLANFLGKVESDATNNKKTTEELNKKANDIKILKKQIEILESYIRNSTKK